jgi:hypothetical protein
MLCCFVCVELLMLLRYVYHEILGNQDVADLPHFRKKTIFGKVFIFYREVTIFYEKRALFFIENISHFLRRNISFVVKGTIFLEN